MLSKISLFEKNFQIYRTGQDETFMQISNKFIMWKLNNPIYHAVNTLLKS